MASELSTLLSDVGYAKVIVALKPDATAGASAAATESSLAAHFSVPSAPQARSLGLVAMRAASRKFKRPTSLESRSVRFYRHLGLALGYVDRQGAASLAADQRVEAVVPAPVLSLIKPVAAEPAKPAPGATWGLVRLRIPELWAAGFKGEGVLVGHLDTGVDGAHPALKGAIGAYAEFDLAGDQVPGAKPRDGGEHGTHTAGTIAARATAKGTFGMAPAAKLASAMVIEGGQVTDRILAGMDWVLAQGVRILSMSLGIRGYTDAFQVVIDALRSHNVLPVIAVGNEGPETSRSPGNYANVLSVGAFGANNKVADFSSSQSFDRPDDPLVPDLVGPGVGILSCVPDNKYELMDGTSMAAPHIAGLAAVLLGAKPEATADELEAAILASCQLASGMQQARANRGIPNAVEAFKQLTGHPLAAAPAAAAAGTKGHARGARKAKRGADKRPTTRRGTHRKIAAGRKKASVRRS
jgi:subtilisin